MRWLAVVVLTGCGFRLIGASPDGGEIDAPGGDAVPVVDAAIDAPGPPTSPRKLTFDNTASSEDLLGFPVLVVLTPDTVDYAVVTNPATDLRFNDADNGPDLPFQVERWVSGGESTVWVRVPQINSGSATDYVLMHFGPDAIGMQDPVAVWASHDVVTHFDPAYANSAGASHNGNPIGMTQGAGKIGMGAMFPGGGNHGVQFGQPQALFNGWQQFTLEFWIYGDYASLSTVAGRSLFMDKGASLNLGRFFVDSLATPPALVLQIDLHFTGAGNDVFLNTRPTPQAWTYIVYTFDGVEVQLYRNGIEEGSHVMTNGTTERLVADATDFYIGSPSQSFAGMLDELRISQIARSLDWIRAQHLSMTRAFVTVGDP